MDYTYALAMTVALSLLVVALQAWGLRRKAIDRSARDTKRDRVRKAKDDDFLILSGRGPASSPWLRVNGCRLSFR